MSKPNIRIVFKGREWCAWSSPGGFFAMPEDEEEFNEQDLQELHLYLKKEGFFDVALSDKNFYTTNMSDDNYEDEKEYTENDIVDILIDNLHDNEDGIRVQGTYDGLGFLTRNRGLVIKIGSQEFQITVTSR